MRSLRSQLLLGIAASTVTGFAVAGVVIFMVLRASLLAEFDSLLAAKARALATLIRQQGEQIEISFADRPMQEFARKIDPEYYQLWDQDGAVLARSRRLEASNLPRLTGSLVMPGFCFTELPDGRRGRVVALAFLPAVDGESLDNALADDEQGHDDDNRDQLDFAYRRQVTLVVARETAVIDQAVWRWALLIILISAAAVCAVLSGVYWLVNRSLQPIERLASQIEALDEQGLAHRFQRSGLPLEIDPVVQRLNELLGRLEDAFQRERILTANVAHELRTPLAGLLTTLNVTLSRSRDSHQYRQALLTCNKICDDLQRLVAALLAMASVEAGRLVPQRSAVELDDLVSQRWAACRGRAVERSLDVRLAGPRDLIMHTDATQLGIVLTNLFDNAVEYTNRGGRVDIEWTGGAGCIRLTVANTGCRLTDEQLTRVFDRFWRGDSSRASDGVHTGLGLALCRKIMEVLGGTIAAASRNGRFVVHLEFSL